jgi:hypothetical protein
LRRAQTFLRALGIEIAFGREGHAGNRIIRIHAAVANTVSSNRDPRSEPWSEVCDDDSCPDLVGQCPIGQGQRQTMPTMLTQTPPFV